MKAIVTGGCGFIGHNLVKSLHADGWDVIVFDNLSTGLKSNHVPGVTYHYRSVLDKSKLQDSICNNNPDVIFHQAAIPRVAYSVEYPYETAVENVMGTISVLDAVRLSRRNCRVIIASSSSVYGGADELPTPEDCPCDPSSPYALDKWQAEHWCKMYADLYEMDIACLRYFNVFGAHSMFGGAYSTVLCGWLYSIYVDPKVRPFLEGDGKQTRDFCYIDNVVSANKLAAKYSGRFEGDCFNVAQGLSHSLNDVKKLLEKITGQVLDLEMRPERVGDVKHTLADISKAESVFNYNPDKDFEKQVTRMADWYRDEYPKGS